MCGCVYMPPSATAFFLVCIPLAASASFHSGRPLSNPARQLQLTAPCRTARPACELTDLPPRPDPSRLVSSLDVSTQRLVFAGISAGVVAGTAAFATLLSRLDAFVANAPAVLPIPLGLAFTVAGVTHFTLTDMYVRLTPPRGTWGCWQVFLACHHACRHHTCVTTHIAGYQLRHRLASSPPPHSPRPLPPPTRSRKCSPAARCRLRAPTCSGSATGNPHTQLLSQASVDSVFFTRCTCGQAVPHLLDGRGRGGRRRVPRALGGPHSSPASTRRARREACSTRPAVNRSASCCEQASCFLR